MATIRNPIEWSADHLRSATQHTASLARSLAGEKKKIYQIYRLLIIRSELNDIRDAALKGLTISQPAGPTFWPCLPFIRSQA